MRKVAVLLDDATARWARREATKRHISLSSFVGEVVRQRMDRDAAYAAARLEFGVQRPHRLKARGASYPTRDEIHDR